MIMSTNKTVFTDFLVTLSELLKEGHLTPLEYVDLLHRFFEEYRKEKNGQT